MLVKRLCSGVTTKILDSDSKTPSRKIQFFSVVSPNKYVQTLLAPQYKIIFPLPVLY